MKHTMKLHKTPFDMIESGEKVYELRLYDEKRQAIKVGDTIEFSESTDPLRKMTVRVLSMSVFESFAALYSALPLDKCGYRQDELATASPEDMTAYYAKDEEARYGAVAIEVKRE